MRNIQTITAHGIPITIERIGDSYLVHKPVEMEHESFITRVIGGRTKRIIIAASDALTLIVRIFEPPDADYPGEFVPEIEFS